MDKLLQQILKKITIKNVHSQIPPTDPEKNYNQKMYTTKLLMQILKIKKIKKIYMPK